VHVNYNPFIQTLPLSSLKLYLSILMIKYLSITSDWFDLRLSEVET